MTYIVACERGCIMPRPKITLAISAVIIFSALSVGAFAQASYEDWVRIAPALGMPVKSVAVSPNYGTDHTVFVGTVGHGVWRSQDSGETWIQSTSSSTLATLTVAAVAVSPNYATDHTVFAYTIDGPTNQEGRLYKSTNANTTFTFSLLSYRGYPGTAMAISPDYNDAGADGTAARTVFVASNGGGLYKSTNGGTTLNVVSSVDLPTIYCLSISPQYPSDLTLFIGGFDDAKEPARRLVGSTSTKLYNGLGAGIGETVTSMHVPPDYNSGNQMVFAGTSGHGMYYTTNNGSNWYTRCDSAPTGSVPSVNAIAMSPDGDTRLQEGRADGIKRSSNHGLNCYDSTPNGAVTCIAYDPGWNGSVRCDIFVGTDNGLYKKSCTTSVTNTGIPAKFNISSISAAPNMGTVFAGSRTWGLFKSLNGTSFVQYNTFQGCSPDNYNCSFYAADIKAVAVAPTYSPTGTCDTTAKTLFVATYDKGVFKSTDGGASFTAMNSGWTTPPVIMDMSISPNYATDSTIYVATWGEGVYRWTGSSWLSRKSGIDLNVYTIEVCPGYNYSAAAGWQNHTIFCGTDGATQSSLCYSTTDGTSWTAVSAFPAYVATCVGYSNNFASDGLVFAGTWGNGVYKSADMTWSTWNSYGLAGKYLNGLAVSPAFTSTGSMIAACFDGPYYHQGTSWIPSNFNDFTPANQNTFCAAFDPGSGYSNRCYIGMTDDRVWYSDDYGANFTQASGFSSLPDDVHNTVSHPANPDMLFCSSPSLGVFLSLDKGDTFHPWNRGCVDSAYGLGIEDAIETTTTDKVDVVWVGAAASSTDTTGQGMKYRKILRPTSGSGIDYSTNVWTYTNRTYGIFKRFAVLGSTGANPGWSSSPGRGLFKHDAGIYATWYAVNTNLPTNPPATDIKFGYASPPVTPLTSGTMVSGSVAYDSFVYYSITVPTGAVSLTCVMNAISNDPDMYVKYGSVPTKYSYDYFLNSGGTPETILINGGSSPRPLKAGTWYIGIRGYSAGTNSYDLTATVSMTFAESTSIEIVPALPRRPESAPSRFEKIPVPDAPSGGVAWGTVNGTGVAQNSGSGWEVRIGVPPTDLTNTDVQTVLQTSDLTLIAGCLGGVWYSPSPDQGMTTWYESTPQVAGNCSYDFRDLLECSNGDVLLAANGTGTSTPGGVWLSGDMGRHWMRISSGFDADYQMLEDIVVDSDAIQPSYYSSTDTTGVYTRTITASNYPTVTSLTFTSGSTAGGTTTTVNGTGFSQDCPTGEPADCNNVTNPVVMFGETPANSTTWVNSTQLTAESPAHAAGSVAVTVRNPDTRQGGTATFTFSCAIPSGLTNNTATDVSGCADTGVLISWNQNPTNWGDAGDGTRTYDIVRSGTDIQTGITYGTTTFTDTTGTNGTSYTYRVRYNNGCGENALTTGASATDNVISPPAVDVTPNGTTTVCTSANIVFTATATGGTAPYSYQWTRDGSDISGATNSTYTASYATAQSHNYNCKAASSGCATVAQDPSASTGTWVAPPSLVDVVPNGATSVCTSSNITFTANVTGAGTPNYQWTENGADISGATSSTLTRSKASAGSFTYNCKVNMTGCTTVVQDATASTGTWIAPPTSVTVTPSGATTVCTGSNIIFTATVTGGATPVYQWTENGTNITGATNSTYTANIASAGSYTYTCIVYNSGCATTVTDSTPSTGTWVAPPTGVAVTPSGTTTVCMGNSIVFTATVTGGASPVYQWTVDGSNISGATNSTYTANFSDGSYIFNCLVYNSGCTTTVSDVTPSTGVWVAPPTGVTVTPSGTTTVCTGSNIVFIATVSGGASPVYQWTENGSNIAGATNSTYTANKASAGSYTYTCIVYNSGCATTVTDSTPSTGTWVVPPTGVTVTPSGTTTVCTGSNIVFTATVSGGASPVYQWTENGSNMAGATNSTYTANKASAGSYNYTCIVYNSGCATTVTDSTPSSGNWVAPPSVDVTPSGTTTACTGTEIVFSATASGGTAPYAYQWTEDGTDISGATNSTYAAYRASANSFTYNCKVSSTGCATTAQDATASTGTWVAPPTVNVTPNDTTTVCTGSNIVFTATASGGTAPYTYQWTEDGSSIPGATDSTMTVTKVAAQGHSYNCKAYSAGCAIAGQDATASSGSWVDPPSVNVLPNGTTTVLAGNPITFSAMASGGSSPYTYQWTEDGANVTGATDSTLTRTYGVAQSHLYNCKVRSTGCLTPAQDATDSTGVWQVDPPPECAPGDTPETAQNWSGKTVHSWPAAARATGYILYRGQSADLANLLDPAEDSCTKYDGPGTSLAVSDDPAALAAGDFYWYLVTAYNASGEGSPGSATSGVRTVDSSGPCL